MTTIDDIKPKPCDRSDIHFPHGGVDSEGPYACPGIEDEAARLEMLSKLKELREKADAIQQERDDQLQHDVGLIERLNGLFFEEAQQRHDMGALKYGPVKFFEVDSLEEAIQEILDLANYARYTYIKLRLLQAQLTEFESVIAALREARKDIVVQQSEAPPVFTNPFRKD